MAQCTQIKRNGQQCKASAIKGREKCRVHGGKTPRGKKSPQYKHGFFARHWADKEQALYDALSKGEMDGLRYAHECHALATMRLNEVLSAADKVDVTSKDGRSIQGVVEAAQREYRLSAYLVSQAESIHNEEAQENKTPFTIQVIQPSPPPSVESVAADGDDG